MSRVRRLSGLGWDSSRRCFLLGIVAVLALVVGFPQTLHLRLNVSESMPRGLYRVMHEQEIQRGSMVSVCVDERLAALALDRHYLARGACPSGTEPLLKRVAAREGDIVQTSERTVSINGSTLASSETSTTDSLGRTLNHFPWGDHRLAEGELWLFSERDRSWDSRYFGPVRVGEVVDIVEPLLTIH